VFFDLDGTLIDTAPDMGGALNRMLAAVLPSCSTNSTRSDWQSES